jgi:hypothetical protein
MEAEHRDIRGSRKYEEDRLTLQMEDMEDIDQLLECGDDLLDIEQTAFMASSKTMLSMIDNMLLAIDQRMEFNLKSHHPSA